MYEGKFVFQNRLGQPYFWKEIYCFSQFYFVLQDNLQVQAPGEAYIWRGDLTEGFMGYNFVGLICGGAYFWNFTVFIINIKIIVMYKNSEYSVPQTEQNPLQYRFGPPMAL